MDDVGHRVDCNAAREGTMGISAWGAGTDYRNVRQVSATEKDEA
jgi:hypothetical protein